MITCEACGLRVENGPNGCACYDNRPLYDNDGVFRGDDSEPLEIPADDDASVDWEEFAQWYDLQEQPEDYRF